MDEILSVRLPKAMAAELARRSKAAGMTKGEFLRDSFRARVKRDRWEELCAKVRVQAQSRGIYTDEDVFRAIGADR